ncbi:MAG: HEPN domain-containing protein [Spirochaetes bacterium]|nr:HEPN domain-containing protein [Spirochaetota bacterium]
MTIDSTDRISLIKHRLKRAEETHSESQLLFDNNMFTAAVNRIYYSMFYSLSALAISKGLQTGKHAQLIGWFNKEYIKSGIIAPRFSKILSQAFDKRMFGDYADIPEFTKNEVEKMISECK